MATMAVKDASGTTVYLEVESGTGALGDPYKIRNYVSVTNTSIAVTDNGGSLTVDGTVAVSNATFPVTDNGGSLTVDGTVAFSNTSIGVTDNAGSLTVDDGGGSLTVDGTIAFSNTSINTQGMVAHDAVDSGNPHKMGARAEASMKTATMVADADRTDLIADLDGAQVMKPFTVYGDIISEAISDTTGNSTAFTNFGAGGAGVRNYVTSIVAYNSSSTTSNVDLRDGTAGSVIFRFPVIAASGIVINFPVPLRQPTANTALAYDGSAAASTLYISMVGFQSKL